MAKDREGDSSAPTPPPNQSKRPSLNQYQHVSHDSDSQLSDHAIPHSHQRQKHHKHVVGGGRMHTRVPSSKALHKITKANLQITNTQPPRRNPSPSPDTSDRIDRPSMNASTHRRSTSDVKIPRDSSSTNLKKNSSHTSLKRNRSHVEVGKKTKAATSIKRSSSHKEVTKLKGAKGQVHFDLGNDGHEDEWVDASSTASPYLSRRGSVAESGPSSVKRAEHENKNTRPHTPAGGQSVESHGQERETPDRETVTHKEYLTSRLLKRTPSHSAAPMMSTETVTVPPGTGSPDSGLSRASSTLYGTPKFGGTHDELISRFVNGPRSGVNPESGSFYSPKKPVGGPSTKRTRRPRSLENIHQEQRNFTADVLVDEDDSALAPRTKRSGYSAAPADKSRTQQKLNLQRASSTIEPAPTGGGVGASGASPLVGGGGYDNRDPRIGKLLERTGMEYLVVRRYQNPIARSIARLQQLPDADKTLHIPKQNGSNGATVGKKPAELGGRYNPASSLVDAHRSRPETPRRAPSIRSNGATSSFEARDEGGHDRLSGSSYVEGDGDTIAALLRNLWDKSMDLSASQD